MTTITFSRASETPTPAGIVNSLIASFAEFCAGAREGREIEARFAPIPGCPAPISRRSA